MLIYDYAWYLVMYSLAMTVIWIQTEFIDKIESKEIYIEGWHFVKKEKQEKRKLRMQIKNPRSGIFLRLKIRVKIPGRGILKAEKSMSKFPDREFLKAEKEGKSFSLFSFCITI